MQPPGFGPVMYSSRQGAQRRSSAIDGHSTGALQEHPVYAQSVRLLPRRRPKIEKLKQAGDVEGLRAMLDYRDTRAATDGVLWDLGAPVRAEATTALAGLDGQAAEEGLTHALADPHPLVRKAALDAHRRDCRGLPPSTGCFRGSCRGRSPATTRRSRRRSRSWSTGRRRGLRRTSPCGCSTLRPPSSTTATRTRSPRFWLPIRVGRPRRRSSRTSSSAELAQPASGERAARAEKLLGWLGAPGAETVLGALESNRASAAVVRAAAALRDARAVEPLVNLLGAQEPEVRAAAATALGRLNDTRAVQALVASTQDPEQEVRDAASEALNGMGMAAVIVVVASVMRDAVRERARTAARARPARRSRSLPVRRRTACRRRLRPRLPVASARDRTRAPADLDAGGPRTAFQARGRQAVSAAVQPR